ncbi:MAG: hypothetical protein AAFQ80_00930 [Cyanobacteria bacterium J06621_8]
MATIGKIAGITILASCWHISYAWALPPATDTPEEILRTEIILEGRSPIDGQPLSASEYEELRADLAQSRFSPQVDSDIRQIIFLLQIRKFIKTIIPFI